MPAIIYRFGTFYSFDSSITVSTFKMIKNGQYSIIGDGNVYWNLISVDDAAKAIVKAVNNAENNKGKIFNICDDEPVLYKDLVSFTAEKLNAVKPGNISVSAGEQLIGTGFVEYCFLPTDAVIKKQKKN